MEKYWLKSIEDTLKKERDTRIKRTVEILEDIIPEDVYMKNHLISLDEDGKGKFSYRKNRANVIQWRCERSRCAKGLSTGDPKKTRANSCPAYVSFQFVTSDNFRGCIIREMCEHCGHDIQNPQEDAVNRISEDLVEYIHECISQGLSNSVILLKTVDWAQNLGKMDIMERRYFVSPEDIIRIRKSFNKWIRMDGNDCVAVGKLIKSDLKDSILHYQPLSHSEDQPLIVVYSSAWQLEQLKKFGGSMIFLDATYKSITQYGFAFYAVMVKNEQGKGVPVSFFILSKETSCTLEICLRKLKEAADDLSPRCVMVDRDQTEIKAIKTVFPHTTVLLCWFHVLQAIHRWLVKQDGGHLRDPAARNFVIQRVFALKHCHTEKEFQQTAKEVFEDIERETQSTQVSKYLQENWFQCGAMWSNFGRMFFHHQSETNNVVERFFNGMKYNFLGGYCNKRLDDLLLILHNHVVRYYSHLEYLRNAGRVPTTVPHPQHHSAVSAERMRSHGFDQNVRHVSEACFHVPSESTPDTFYEVDLLYCVCQCAFHGQGHICKHVLLAQMVSKDLIDIAALREDKANMLYTANQYVSDEKTLVIHNGGQLSIVNVTKQQCSCFANSFGEVCVCLLVAKKVSEGLISTTENTEIVTEQNQDDSLPTQFEPPVGQMSKHCIKRMLNDLRNWCETEEYHPSLNLYSAIKHAHQLVFGSFKTVCKKRKTERLHKYRKNIELCKRQIANAHNYTKTHNQKRQIYTVHGDGAFKRKRSRQRTLRQDMVHNKSNKRHN